MTDSFQLQRFRDAQQGVFETALAELRAGRKQTHWMWFVFPQLAGLGRSPTAQFYAIRSAREARAFLADPLLGRRYREAVEAMREWAGRRDAIAILGEVDAIKLRSSLTLFETVSGDPLFADALKDFFGEPDPETLRLLQQT
ncbi:MAG TPA: DUF1810 domain-containing protein [Sphingomicrobium sp.]|nr:DUF1810 domain-containing protein [Sphingomicrobium sp.]